MTINQKYKERKPEETISIIQKFFEERGFTLKIKEQGFSEIGSYSYHIVLYYQNQFIAFSNGKGTSEKFALASGLAEMYERFCNMANSLWNKSALSKVIELNKEKHGYCLKEDERIVPYEEVLKEPLIKETFLDWCQNEEMALKLIKIILGENAILVPFKNIITDDVKYLDKRICTRVVKTTGMAAGNNFIEAFNQGFSEVLERYVEKDSLEAMESFKYSVLDLSKIQDPTNKRMVDKIFEEGYDLYVIDFSYEYNLPVLAAILINKKQHWARINYGCFPIFEIAFERTLTEMFQNITSFKDNFAIIYMPHDSVNSESVLIENDSTMVHTSYIPKDFLTKKEYVESENKNCFLSNKNATNEEIFDYYKQLIKEFDLNVYVEENSLTPELSSIMIWCDEIPLYPKYSHVGKLEKEDYDYIVSLTESYNALFQKVIDKTCYFDDSMRYLTNIHDTEKMNNFIGWIVPRDWVCGITGGRIWATTLPELFYNSMEEGIVDQSLTEMPFYNEVSTLLTLSRYHKGNIDYEIVEKEMKELGFNNFTKNDYENSEDIGYCMIRAFLIPSWKFYHSQLFKEISSKYTK